MNKKIISMLIALSMLASHAIVFAQTDTAAPIDVTTATEVVEEVQNETQNEEAAEETEIKRTVVATEGFIKGLDNCDVVSGKGFKEKNGELQFKNKKTSETDNILMFKNLTIDNADLEFDLKIKSGVYVGVILRSTDNTSMYQVRFYKNEGKVVLLKKVKGGEFVEIKKANVKIKSDEFSKVGIRLVDSLISLRVDGKAIFTDVKDFSLKAGGVGIDADNAEATMDNFEIVKYSDVDYTVVIKDPNATEKIKNIYVAPTGTSGNGTKNNPIVGIENARKAANSAKKGGVEVNVIFLAGTYTFDQTWAFGEEDSGTKEAPVTYKAEEGAKVVFTTAKKIDHAGAKPVTGKMENRIHSNAKGKVVQIKLSNNVFPEDLMNFAKNSKEQGKGVTQRLKPPMIFLNDQQLNVARWPNGDYATIYAAETGGIHTSGGKKNDGGAIYYNNTEPNNWVNAEYLFVEGYLSQDWNAEWAAIDRVNTEENKLEFKYFTSYGIFAKKRWCAVNLIEELDIPGEYYIDPDEKMLYIYPPQELKATDKLTVAQPINLLQFNKASYINIEGIEISNVGAAPTPNYASMATGQGIAINRNARYITIKDCNIKNTGNSGIWVEGIGHKITGCQIYNTGIDGITIDYAGDRTTLTPSEIVVENCIISDVVHNTGLCEYSGIRIDRNTVDVHIRNNIFHNTEGCAIRYAGNGHQIYHNEFSSTVFASADMGVIYTGRTLTDWGCKVYENYLHDIGGASDSLAFGCHGIYWDDCITGQEFSRNITVANNRTKCSVNHLSGGDHLFNGNTSVAGAEAIIYDTRGLRTAEQWLDPSWLNDRMHWNKVDATSPAFREKYPEVERQLQKIKDNDGLVFDAVITNNLFVDTLGNATRERVREDYIYENNVDLQDIKEDRYHEIFVDPANHDYRVTDEAREKYNLPKDLLGEEFDLNQIGLQKELKLNEDRMKVELLAPQNKSTDAQPSRTSLAWTKAEAADQYFWTIATDPNFENIVQSGKTVLRAADPVGLKPNTTYYWKVKAVNKSRQIGATTETEVWSFTTGNDVVITIPLEHKIAQAKETINSIREGTGVGQYHYGTKDLITNEMEKAQAALSSETKTQETVDKATMDLNTVLQGLGEYINVGYVTVNLDPAINIIESSKVGSVERNDNSVTLKTGDKESFFLFEEELSNYNVMKFKTKVDHINNGWLAYGLRIGNANSAIYSQPSYYILVKDEVFELQKQGVIYQTLPNNGKFKYNEWNDMEFAAVTTSKGIHMFFKLNGEVMFDFLDTTGANNELGKFGVYNTAKNATVEIAPPDILPTGQFERSPEIQKQLDSDAKILYIDHADVKKVGNWLGGTNVPEFRVGYNSTLSTYSQAGGNTFTWKMTGEQKDNAKNYRVSYYHMPVEGGDPEVKVTLEGYAGTYKTTIDLSKGEKGWVDLGTFKFQDADNIGRLEITFEPSGKGIAWLNSIEFEPTDSTVNMLKKGLVE